MKKFLLILALAAVVAALPLEAKRVKGTVKGAGRPLSGVIVSDGYSFTQTSASGTFVLNTHKDARYVFVVTPAGFVADYTSGAPQFYLPVGAGKFNFELQPFGEGEDYTLFSISDPQMQSQRHFERFCGRPLGDLRGMARRCSAQHPTVGVVLGDVAWNKHWVYEPYKAAIATTGIPFYTVIGNHDFIQDRGGIAAAERFEKAFGPYNFAFWLGRDLVIGLNNLIFKASGKDDPELTSNNYQEGYSQEALNFVKGLLRFVPKGTHLFIAQHSPLRIMDETPSRDIVAADQMLALLEGYPTDILSGHTHVMSKVQLTPWVRDNNAAAIGGAWWDTDWCRDGTPRGYEVVTSEGGVRSWRWHNLDYPDSYQVQFVGMDQALQHRNSVVANAWGADENWTCTWTQDGVPMGPLSLEYDQSASYKAEILAAFQGDYKKVPGYKRPGAMKHYYVATPSQYAREVSMTVTAPDGRSWSHTFDLQGSYIDLQAHRGGAGLMPENTLSSMRKALKLNVNTLEFDLQLSADGQVVVSHDNYFHPRYSMRPDSSLIQKSDPKEYLYTMPYDSIVKYDVGLRYVDRWPTQKKVAEHKPLASDIIDFAESYTREHGLSPVRYNIEIKSRTGEGEGTLWPHYKEFCDKCMEVLLSKNLGDRLVVQTFDVRALEYVHEKYPQVHLSYLTEDETEIATILSQISFLPTWWSPNHEVVTRENVAYCHALGVKVVPWTVDDPEEMRRMAQCGVEAIISNYPDRLIEVFRK